MEPSEVYDSITDIRNDVKIILEKLTTFESETDKRLSILEYKESTKVSKHVVGILKTIISMVTGGVLLYLITNSFR